MAVRTSVRGLTEAEVIRAVGTGARTFHIHERLRARLALTKSDHLHRAALLRRLKRMEADGKIMRSQHSFGNDYHWVVREDATHAPRV